MPGHAAAARARGSREGPSQEQIEVLWYWVSKQPAPPALRPSTAAPPCSESPRGHVLSPGCLPARTSPAQPSASVGIGA